MADRLEQADALDEWVALGVPPGANTVADAAGDLRELERLRKLVIEGARYETLFQWAREQDR